MEEGKLDSGIICAETFDFDVVRKIYNPYDNLELSVILNNDGSQDKRVLAPFAEAVLASPGSEPSDGIVYHHGEGLFAHPGRRGLFKGSAGRF